MSLNASMNAALAGLSLTSKRAETVAANVANADRPGYARRSVEAGTRGISLAPDVSAIGRAGDARLTALRREASADAGNAEVARGFHAALDGAIGDPDRAGSLQDRLARLDSALLVAAANPASEAALSDVAHSASDLAGKIGTLDALVARERQAAEDGIAATVAQLNDDLAEVAKINADIRRQGTSDHVSANLLDRRDVVIDRISEQIPVHVLRRDGGAVALVSQGGRILLEDRPVEIAFEGKSPVTTEMTFPGGLNGLAIGGKPVADHGPTGPLGGGRLSALFTVRDEAAPKATARLDAFASELTTRFAAPETDPTLPPGAPGLFALAPAGPGTPGPAARLSLNPAIEPGDPATLSLLRDGFGPMAGPPGLLGRLSDAVNRVGPPADATLGMGSRDLPGHAAALRSAISADRLRADRVADAARETADARTASRDGGAVDVDAEMRRLIDIERSYAANARVLQVAGDMLDRLTEI